MNELITAVYCLVGFLIGIWRLSKVSKNENSYTAFIGVAFIMVLWPIYIIYKLLIHYAEQQISLWTQTRNEN